MPKKRIFPVYRPEENAPYTGPWADADTSGNNCPDGLCIVARNAMLTGSHTLAGQGVDQVEFPTQAQQDQYWAGYHARWGDQESRPVRDGTLADEHGKIPYEFKGQTDGKPKEEPKSVTG